MFERYLEKRRRLLGVRTDLIEEFVAVLKRDRKAQFGLVSTSLVVLIAILAPVLAPYDPMAIPFPALQPPSVAHPFGTDTFGRDVLSRLIHGARMSLGIGIAAVLIGSISGVIVGLISGYFGGFVDDVLMRFVDAVWAFPYILIAIILVVIFGNGFWNVALAIGIANFDDFARITRGEVLKVREETYILAAESVGMGKYGIMVREIFPNVVAPIIVQFTVLLPRAMISEATLSFLGLGVKPTTPTWGSILREGRNLIVDTWWLSLTPGIAIMITVIGINMLGDALQDAFDVKEEGR